MPDKNKIKASLKNNKILLSNFSYLSFLQIFNMVLPLLTYPYLIRILGAELYGLIIFAQAVTAYFTIFINFGFNISATKEIALNQGNIKKISEIVSSVLVLQFLIWLACFLVFCVLIFEIPEMTKYKTLYILSFLLTFNELLFPQWFFQGIEKMKFITYINLSVRFLFACLIFLFVKSKSDYLLVPLFNALGAILGGLTALYIVFVKYNVQFKLYSVSTLKNYLLDSVHLFLTKLALLIKDKSIVLILGFIFSKTIVAYYDLAQKFVGLFIAIYQNVPTVVLPRLIQNKSYSLAKKVFLLSIGLSVFYYLFLVIFAHYIVVLFAGKEMLAAINYIYIVGLLVLLNPLNTLLNYYLIVNKLENKMLISVMISLVSFVLIILLGLYFRNVNIMLFSMVISGLLEIFYKLFLFRNDPELKKFIL